MFRIRFHGRGGQGIKTASRILGSAFFIEGFEVQDAPVYGAERRGAPMFAYVRASREPIQERGPVSHPDLVIVVDESLIAIPAARVLEGITPQTVLLINSAVSAREWRYRLGLTAPVVILPVSDELENHPELPHVGAMCAGAAAQLVGQLSRESLEAAIRRELADLTTEVVARNLELTLGAYESVQGDSGIVVEGGDVVVGAHVRPDWVDLAVEAPAMSAPHIQGGVTSVQVKTGAWRSIRPVIDPARCNRCTWVCSTLCPDSAISVTGDGRPEIDYDHCKGCLICVAVCPPHAIEAVPEAAFPAEVE